MHIRRQGVKKSGFIRRVMGEGVVRATEVAEVGFAGEANHFIAAGGFLDGDATGGASGLEN